ncbi:type II toxin-antitoxin system HicA family toxin [Nitratidesulfovibrio vulgaris]|uniref:type II toxin-antitoxin system HicA family toxin n=1 Tax=Nitratidesulfovibrio vulgaris TaxID=881 RepID=UPI001CBC4A4D|nr:type II toxin-antitoxin system HicA family toxin [Nitratidesulfovibrio vulgaris]
MIKILKAFGWYLLKIVGDHHQFKHPTRPGKVTIPHPKKDLAIGTLKAIEKQSGIKLR